MKTVHHIGLNCRNLKAQEQFYTKHFGFRRSRVFNAGAPDEFIMLRLGSICLELFSAKPDAKHLRASEQPVGFRHLAFETSDLEATVAALHADGIETEDIIDCDSTVKGMRICFFKDPDGNLLELSEGYTDQFTG